MKKIYLLNILIVSCFLFSCSTNRISTSNNYPSEKEILLINNNKYYPIASIIGSSGSEAIKAEHDRLIIKKIQEKERKLSSIKGISTSKKNNEGEFLLTGDNDILFEYDSFLLTEEAINILNQISDIISDGPGTNIEIVGHTDIKGTHEYNQHLSENRAKSVGEFFRKKGFSNIKEKGKSFDEPRCDNNSEEGRKQNRRVELTLKFDNIQI